MEILSFCRNLKGFYILTLSWWREFISTMQDGSKYVRPSPITIRIRPRGACVTSCVNATCARLLWPLIIGVIGIVQSRPYENSVLARITNSNAQQRNAIDTNNAPTQAPNSYVEAKLLCRYFNPNIPQYPSYLPPPPPPMKPCECRRLPCRYRLLP
jgi:hypothetical protein